MADLKVGTTVGGSSIWTQSNFPLFPAGNSLLYRDFTLYSTNDKPQAADNDFVSKAQGGTYTGALTLINSNSTAQMLNIQGSAAGLMLSIANADGTLTNNNYQMYAQGDLLRFRGPNGTDAGLIDIFQWNNASGAKQFEVRGSIKVLTGGRIFDSGGGVVYSPQNKPTAADVGALALTGGTVTGEIITTSTGGNNFRMSNNNSKSVFQRADTSNWYFLISDTVTGTYNNLRPISIGISDGKVSMAHNVSIGSGLTVSGGQTISTGNLNVSAGSITSSANISTSSSFIGSDIRVGTARVVNGSYELNFSNGANGTIQVNRTGNVSVMDFGALPLRTVGPLHVATTNGSFLTWQGTHMLWNESGDGRGSIVVNRGGGAGGFNFRFVNNENTVETGSVRMDAAGTLRATGDLIAGNRVYTNSGNSFLAYDGNVFGAVFGNDYLTNWVNNNYYPRGSGDGAYARANDAWNKANDAQINRAQWVRTAGQYYTDYMGNQYRNIIVPAGNVMIGLAANGSSLDAGRIIYGRLQVYKDNGAWMDSAT